MKVIDLKTRTIYVDDIQQIYMETNYNPTRYNIKTTYDTYLVDKEDYFKVKDYLLSLNDEVEIIEEDKKIERFDPCLGGIMSYDSVEHIFETYKDKINEIIEVLNNKEKE